ncbi:protelomerase family protein [Trichormus variabilis]|uniref:Telomere resolvase ResT/TelK catalytic domain-containing protein n=1 Tax=Trichormus variabilis NIES-23 TaxID=1973479 RepID=A0A1Z4KX90_ANAVA|nr:protelomerase family protein [Trichormus variabilis]MBD2352840.1 hypothetical protein [Trichormus variabilis FACHB-171]BAY73585.1 hypothetical protein NIES23_64370 [Trichormus variabilis NIES-23]
MTLNELKTQAQQLGITKETVKTFGNLSAKATWQAAIDSRNEQEAYEKARERMNKESYGVEHLPESPINQEFIDASNEFYSEQELAEINNQDYMDNALVIPTRHDQIIEGTETKKAANQAVADHVATLTNVETIKTVMNAHHDWLVARASKTSLKGDFGQLANMISELVADSYPEHLKADYKGYPNHLAVAMARTWSNTHREAQTVPDDNDPLPAPKLDANYYIDWAKNRLQSQDWRELLIAIAFLTGRRPNEIAIITQWEPYDEFSMLYRGLSKKPELDTQVIGATLHDATEIYEAVCRLRKMHGFEKCYEVYQETDDIVLARDKFNSSYNGGTGGLSAFFKSVFNEFQGDAVRNCRDFYVCVNFAIHQEKYQCSIQDSLKFCQKIIGHVNTGESLNYTKFKFSSLPNIDLFPENYLSIASYTVPENEKTKEVKMVSFDILAHQDWVDNANIESRFLKIYSENNGDIQEVIKQIDLMLSTGKGLNHAVKRPSKVTENLEKVLESIADYNRFLMNDHSQLETHKLYLYVSKSSILNIYTECEGKQPAPITLQEFYEKNTDKINDANIWCQPDDKRINNYHLRVAKDGKNNNKEIVFDAIKAIYLNK